MKITFLGTSHGVPAADRYCSCTMIESNGAIYCIDAGAPIINLLLQKGKDVNSFRALFTTHVHSDHTVGVIHLADLINWYYKDAEADFYITTQAHIESIKGFIQSAGNNARIDEGRVRFHVPTAGLVYEDENIMVEYIPTKHNMTLSYAILVTEGAKRVLFSGDLSHNLRDRDVPAVTEEELDGFVCEMAHQSPADYLPYLPKWRAKKVFFNHVFPLEKYSAIEAMKGKYPFEILTPNDGDSFDI